jgi:hypothetical protein
MSLLKVVASQHAKALLNSGPEPSESNSSTKSKKSRYSWRSLSGRNSSMDRRQRKPEETQIVGETGMYSVETRLPSPMPYHFNDTPHSGLR